MRDKATTVNQLLNVKQVSKMLNIFPHRLSTLLIYCNNWPGGTSQSLRQFFQFELQKLTTILVCFPQAHIKDHIISYTIYLVLTVRRNKV